MSFEEEDDFWNSSDVKAFNFDDEDSTGTANTTNLSSNYAISGPSAQSSLGVKTLGSILAAKPSSNEPFLRPSMIMCNGRNRIELLIEHLDKNVPSIQCQPPKQDPKSYITDIVYKRVPIDFSPYKSKREKLVLLDCAICCCDGNTITAATLFLSKTLRPNIFIEELKKRPTAVDHYLNYLEMTGRSREAIELTRRLSLI